MLVYVKQTMLTRLYTTEEDPALCSIIWGTNFTATPAADENDSNVGGITAASISLNGASAGYVSSGRNSAASAIVASVTVGDNLRDDFYISNEVSIKISIELINVMKPFRIHLDESVITRFEC